MASIRIVLGLLIATVAISSCNKLDPSCVKGTWKDTTSLDSVFFHQITFNDDGSGTYNLNSEGCNGNAFQKQVAFDWTESEGVLTVTQKDSVYNYCTGINVHTDSVYTMAYSCREEGLWLAGVTWVKE